MLVHTNETVRFRYFLDLLMENRRPVMLVSNAGCGKTVLINDKLGGEEEGGERKEEEEGEGGGRWRGRGRGRGRGRDRIIMLYAAR